MTEQELIEQLASCEHASWAKWMKYLFDICEAYSIIDSNGSSYTGVLIPPELVERWQRQINTPYAELSEQEKQSDREEVAKILPIINEYTAFSAQSCSNLVMAIAQLETRIDRIYNEVFKTEDAHVLDDRTRQTLLGRVNELSSMAALGDVSKPWS